MVPPTIGASGLASYKKRDGILGMAKDQTSISWTPLGSLQPGQGPGPFTLKVADLIPPLQQTPVHSPKVMLKVLAQQNQTQPQNRQQQGKGKEVLPGEPVQYVFTFTSVTNARGEADAIKDALSTAMGAFKLSQRPSGGEEIPGALAIANAVTSGTSTAATVGAGGGGGLAADAQRPLWSDDARLLASAELQQSLVKSNPNLQRVFMDSLSNKPENVTTRQFITQFWTARIPLLRAHAIEKSQARGSYNVLSSIKPRVEDNVTRLNISKEQIQLIFNQHPLVKRVYDENVPRLTEQQFWSRFFQSRLFKKLRGERITDVDATDSVLDKYLREDPNAAVAGGDLTTLHVPHIIDLEGNDADVSQRQGNRPNFDMIPTSLDKVPIIRTLNRLSEKIMGNVAPIDRDRHAPAGVDEDTFNELQLRDLRGDEEQNRIILNIRDQSRFFADEKTSVAEAEEASQERRDLVTTLTSLLEDLETIYPADSFPGGVRLDRLVEPDEDEDSSSDDEGTAQPNATKGPKKEPVGSKASLARASEQIFGVIRERRAELDLGSTSSETCGLSSAIYDRLTLTHATTTEFLHQFWQTFLSGNPDRAGEIAALAESLSRAMDRITAVADEAEAERTAEIQRLKLHAKEVMTSTGKNIRPNLKAVEGGGQVVNQLMAPTTKALAKAVAEYKKALTQQSREVPAAAE